MRSIGHIIFRYPEGKAAQSMACEDLLLHQGFDGFQLFARFGPFALRGKIAIPLQVAADFVDAEIDGGLLGWS